MASGRAWERLIELTRAKVVFEAADRHQVARERRQERTAAMAAAPQASL